MHRPMVACSNDFCCSEVHSVSTGCLGEAADAGGGLGADGVDVSHFPGEGAEHCCTRAAEGGLTAEAGGLVSAFGVVGVGGGGGGLGRTEGGVTPCSACAWLALRATSARSNLTLAITSCSVLQRKAAQSTLQSSEAIRSHAFTNQAKVFTHQAQS